jgi:ABC-2 type transport system permease protein
VLHSAIGLGLLNAVLAVAAYAVLRSGWRIKS